MAENNAIRLGRHSLFSHASHTPIIARISHHRKQDYFCHSRTPPPSYALLRTPSPSSHGTAGTVRLHGKWLCTRVRRGVSTRREGYKEDMRRDDRNGPEFWHDDNDWVFGTNRGISGRRTVGTPCTGSTPSSSHTRTSPLPASCMSDRRPDDKAAGMCVGHNPASSRTPTPDSLISHRPWCTRNGVRRNTVAHSGVCRRRATPGTSADRAVPRSTCRVPACSHNGRISSRTPRTEGMAVGGIGEGSDGRREEPCRRSDDTRAWGLCMECQILGVSGEAGHYASFRRNTSEGVCRGRACIRPHDTAVRMCGSHSREAFRRFGRRSTLLRTRSRREHASILRHSSTSAQRFCHTEGNYRNGRSVGIYECHRGAASDRADRTAGPDSPSASYYSEWSAWSFRRDTEWLSRAGTEGNVQHGIARYTYGRREAPCRRGHHRYAVGAKDRIPGFPPSHSSNSTWWEPFQTVPHSTCYT